MGQLQMSMRAPNYAGSNIRDARANPLIKIRQNEDSARLHSDILSGTSTALGLAAPVLSLVPGVGPLLAVGAGLAAAGTSLGAGEVNRGIAEREHSRAVDQYNQDSKEYDMNVADRAAFDADQRRIDKSNNDQLVAKQQAKQQAAYDADQQQKAGAHNELLDAINSLHTARQNQERPQPLTMTASQPEPQQVNPVPERGSRQIQNIGIKIKPRKQKTRVGKQKRK